MVRERWCVFREGWHGSLEKEVLSGGTASSSHWWLFLLFFPSSADAWPVEGKGDTALV